MKSPIRSISAVFRRRRRRGGIFRPYLRLSGKCLEEIGARTGAKVTVTADNGALVIRVTS